VGRRLRVVAEHLLARTQIRVRLLQRPAHGLERRDHVVELVVLRGRSPLQRERWRRPEHVVVTEEAGERREMSRDQPVSEVEDEQGRSEEHTSELQSPDHLVCRLLLEKKKIKQIMKE